MNHIFVSRIPRLQTARKIGNKFLQSLLQKTVKLSQMKFIDEAKINVEAGTGGRGACSFLRLKFMPFGGPDGGDGGDGGSIYLCADESINTLVDYRFVHTYKAKNGKGGSGQNCTGKSGE